MDGDGSCGLLSQAGVLLILSVGCAFFISCLCSLLEAALLSLAPSQLADIRRKFPKTGHLCQQLKHDIDKPIAVILICNTAAHTIGAAVAGAQFNILFGANWLWVFTLALTIAMVQYTEILPKTLGVRFNRAVMIHAARPLSFLVKVMYPLILLVHIINRPFEFRRTEKKLSTADEISALAALARSSQQISSRQEHIIRSVPRLSERTARQVMLPVENVSFLSTEHTLVEAMNFAARDFHTRYPVCEDDDHNKVKGYVNFKELVVTFRSNPEHAGLMDIIRPISFADEDDSAADLLERFASQHCHMAMVRDENGRIIGMLTLEDIVEEILGDLDDEFDPLPRTFYAPSEGFWVVGGGIPMSLLARETRLPLPKRMEPVAVWFARMLGRPPCGGDVLRHGDTEFYVRKIRRGRVLEFNVKKVNSAEEPEKKR